MRAKAENLERSIEELYEIMLDLSKKINEIHRLHFSESDLLKRKNQRQKFLAEILTNPARSSNKT